MSELRAEGCRAKILPEEGGRLASLEVDGWELLVQGGGELFQWGNFAMAPWVGRLRDGVLRFGGKEHRFPLNAPPDAIHGLVTQLPWTEERPGVTSVNLPEPWPWRGHVKHEISLLPGTIAFRLELTADEPMPAALGWHPWFRTWIENADGRRSGPIVLDAEPRLMYENGSDRIPTGNLVSPGPRPWADCFRGFVRPPRLHWPGVLELMVESDCQDWVIYDEEPQGPCVEPWTGPPNGLNVPEPTVVFPDRPLVATMTWRWRLCDSTDRRRLSEPQRDITAEAAAERLRASILGTNSASHGPRG